MQLEAVHCVHVLSAESAHDVVLAYQRIITAAPMPALPRQLRMRSLFALQIINALQDVGHTD